VSKPVDLDKLRSIRYGGRHKGKVKVTTLSDEGQTTGKQIEYGDGRVEAVVKPSAVRASLKVNDG
jgi:hypothetical protein